MPSSSSHRASGEPRTGPGGPAVRRISAGATGRPAGLFGDVRGTAAIEFALVGSALILTIVFISMGGYLLYIGQALDRATAVAARQIMIGAVQKAGTSQSAFVSGVVCPALPLAINCNNVVVNVQTVTEAAQPNGYYGFVNANQTALTTPTLSNANATFTPGTQGAYVYMQVVYPVTFLPAFMAKLLGANATYNGSAAYLEVSTAAFRNEQY